MEQTSFAIAAAAVILTAGTALAQFGPGGYGAGGPRGNAGGQACCLATPSEPATAEEARWLAYMREEEKLARDVYEQLAAKWDLRLFRNIARSEQRHFEAVGTLLARYGVKDPAADMAPGIFTDQNLAALYGQLLTKGMVSLKDALEVGVAIEKADIADLETSLKATSKTDIKTVLTNLLTGSLSHQEAFEYNLEVLAAAR